MKYQDNGYLLDYDQLKASSENKSLHNQTAMHSQIKNKIEKSAKKKQENDERFMKRIRKCFFDRNLRTKISVNNLEQAKPYKFILQDINYDCLSETSCESQITATSVNCPKTSKATFSFLKRDQSASKYHDVYVIQD